jgi:FXSXX-COOH protein
MSASEATSKANGAEPPFNDEVLPPRLVDLSGISLAQLRFVDGSPIADAVARMVQEVQDPGEAIAGFQNAL